ncbi:MAG: sodium:solute symporter [Saprospiraceae bacterium]|nr:sodium:solute symporter [Saprospiraceae bacterium]
MTQLSPQMILGIIVGYFLMLIGIAFVTSRGSSDNESFFMAKRQSPWYLIAIGMIGTSISGITFISVPGWVEARSMSYMQTVMGFLTGYAIIAFVLMPMYYKLNLISIYTYLDKRFGIKSYKTGSAFFLLSRTVGSGFRLYLAALVLHQFVTAPMGVPFWVTVAVTIGLIWSYTFKGGVKTIIWTDLIQTLCLLVTLVMTISMLGDKLGLTFSGIADTVWNSPKSQIFFFEHGWSDAKNFFKQFLSGASICIVMSGLDQDIMQKNLTVKTLKGAQINMLSYGALLGIINFLFLSLGILLFIYAKQNNIAIPMVNGTPRTDLLFPTIALQYSTPVIGVLFFLGILASTYASADSALTALTTAFCIDFLGFEKRADTGDNKRIRTLVHLGFSVVLFFIILLFYFINDSSVIEAIYKAASYTYGPLLGLFTFGFLTNRDIKDNLAPYVCCASPIITYIINANSQAWFNGYKFDFELLILNGLITFLGLWAISTKGNGDKMAQYD